MGTYAGPHGRREGPARLQEEKGRQKLAGSGPPGWGDPLSWPALQPPGIRRPGAACAPSPPAPRPAPRPAWRGSLTYLTYLPHLLRPDGGVRRARARRDGAGGPEGSGRRAAPYEAGGAGRTGGRGESGPPHSCARRAPVGTGAGRRQPQGPPPGKGCGARAPARAPSRGLAARGRSQPRPPPASPVPRVPAARPLGSRGGLARIPGSEPSQAGPGRAATSPTATRGAATPLLPAPARGWLPTRRGTWPSVLALPFTGCSQPLPPLASRGSAKRGLGP